MMAENLYHLFVGVVLPTLPISQQETFLKTLTFNRCIKATETDFFTQFINLLNIPLHLFKINRDDKTEIENLEYFSFETSKWVPRDIEVLSNTKEFILLIHIHGFYAHIATFTEKYSWIEKIGTLFCSQNVPLIEIGFDLLKRENKLSEIETQLRKFHNYIECRNTYGKSMYRILEEKNKTDLIDFLLKADVSFPKLSIDWYIPTIKKWVESRDRFHEFVKNGQIPAIEVFLDENPFSLYCKNKFNISACATAIESKQFETYSFLHSRGLSVTNSEFVKLQNVELLEYLRFNKFPFEITNEKLRILESKTITRNKSNTDLSVAEIYEKLSQIRNFEHVIDILCKTDPLQIVLDYTSVDILSICPYGGPNVRGLADSKINRIFVSGGGGKEQMLGTTAHEMTHLAMFMVYKNASNPYHFEDDSRKKNYHSIVLEMRKGVMNKSITEKIIELVFNYPAPSSWPKELIVRVNHVLAHYGNDFGYNLLQKQAPKLLDFYENQVVPDLKKYNNNHFNPNDYKITAYFHQKFENCQVNFKMLGDFLETVEKKSGIILIKTQSIELTCLKLLQSLKENSNGSFNINNTFLIDSETFFSNEKELKNLSRPHKLLIIANTSTKKDSKKWDEIVKYAREIRKPFIFCLHMENAWFFDNVTLILDDFKFTDFDLKSQHSIVENSMIDFQGNFIGISQLFDSIEPKNLNAIFDSEIVANLIFDQLKPVVGVKISNLPPYIMRKFEENVFDFQKIYHKLKSKATDFKSKENFEEESNKDFWLMRLKNGTTVRIPDKKSVIDSRVNDLSDEYFKSTIFSKTASYEISEETIKETDSKGNQFSFEREIFIVSEADKSSVIISDEIIFSTTNISEKYVQQFYENNPGFNLHWLQRVNDTITWHKTFGSLTNLRHFISSNKAVYSEENVFQKFENQKIILIAATAGMGKSTTATNMAKSLIEKAPTNWVYKINLNNNTEILKKIDKNQSDPNYFLNFLTEFLHLKSNFEKELFKFFCMETEKVYLFLDGADEISPQFTKELIKLIQGLTQTKIKHIIVTVRLNLKTELEDQLNTFAIGISPFTPEDQIRFFENIWQNKKSDGIKAVAKEIVNFLNSSIKEDIRNLLGIPLQTFMLAKICEEKIDSFLINSDEISRFFENLSPLKLYENFTNLKFDILIREKSKFNTDDPATLKSIKILLKTYKKQLQYASVYTLFSAKEVEIFLDSEQLEENEEFINELKNGESYEGIVDGFSDNKPNFIHQTYAEYFCADYLINFRDWTEETENFFFNHILSDKKFQVVRLFLNSYTGKSQILSRKPTYFQIPPSTHQPAYANSEEGKLKILHYLSDLKFSFTTPNEKGMTPLHAATINGHFNVVEFLIAEKIDVNPRSLIGVTPLHLAARNTHLEIVQLLLQFRADINAQMRDGWNALHYAIHMKHYGIVRCLIDNGIDLTATARYGWDAFLLAMETNATEIIQYLISKNVPLNSKTKKGNNAFMLAASNGNLEILQFLANRVDGINVRNEDGANALILASQNNYVPIVRYLLDDLNFNVNSQTNKGWSSLHIAAANNFIDLCQLLIDHKIDSRLEIEGGPCAFQIAAQNGNLEILKLLTLDSIDVNKANVDGATALHMAAQNNHNNIVEYLIANNAEITSVRLSDGSTPLHLAAQNDYKDVVKTLIDHGGDVNAITLDGWTALHLAAQNNHLDTVKILIENKANISATTSINSTVLHHAARNGHIEVVKYLIEKQVNVNAKALGSTSALHLACQYNHPDTVQTLIENHANVNETTVDSWTALHMAAKSNSIKCIDLLLSTPGISVNVPNIEGWTPLHLACQYNNIKIVHSLIANHAEINATNPQGGTPLHLAAQGNHIEVAKYLLENNANVHATNTVQWNSLHLVSQFNYVEMGKLLISHNININAQNTNGATPLHIAAQNNHVEFSRLLLQHGVETDLRDSDGFNAFHMAAHSHSLNVLQLLIDHGVDLNTTIPGEENAIILAAVNGHWMVIKLLMGYGMDVNYQDLNGWCALHFAVHNNRLQTVRFLLAQSNVDVNLKTNRGWNALHFAASIDNLEMAQLLVKKKIDYNVRNYQNETAFDVANNNYAANIVSNWNTIIDSNVKP